MKPRIYVASKTKHAGKWLEFRDRGYNIISTWIDEAGPGQSKSLSDLARRCIEEAKSADVLIVYAEEGDTPLKGAYIEIGAALANNIPIYAVGPVISETNCFPHHAFWFKLDSLERAFKSISYFKLLWSKIKRKI